MAIWIFGVGLLATLIALGVIDARTYRLPDILTLPLTAAGLLQAWVLGTGVPASLIGAGLGYLALLAIERGYKRLRGIDGLGRGDAKLLAAGGAWCGWTGLPFIVLIASGTGLLMMLLPSLRTRSRIPFGPFLALGIACTWIAIRIS